MQWSFLPSVENAAKALLPTTTVKGTGAYSLFNLNAGWNVNDTIQVRAGIDNVLDRAPSVVGANPTVGDNNSDQTNLNFYDGLGRRFYFGIKATL